MNIQEIENNPQILTSLNTVADYWDHIANADILVDILSNPQLSNKLPDTLKAELKIMHVAITEHPELKEIIREFGNKLMFGLGFTISEIVHVSCIVITHFDYPDYFTPVGWASIFSGLLLSMGGGIAAFYSRLQDYEYYRYVLRQGRMSGRES